MTLFSRRRMVWGLSIYAVLVVVTLGLTRLERQRIDESATSPAITAQPGPIDGRALLADIERLASPAFEGRRTGTPGSRLTQEFIIDRLRGIKAAPAFESYRQPFSFTRHSIRGLFSPSRPYKTHYPDAANLGAIIRGTARPERFIALSAHYDSFGMQGGTLFPGADDNASGIAVLLGVARILSERPAQHSVLILALDAEELGLRGAKHFVQNPAVDLALIDAVVNLDMVGRADANRLVATGPWHYPALEAPVRTAAAGRNIAVVFGHDRPHYRSGLVENWTNASDHGAFHQAGVPFVYFGVEDYPDYHKPTDTADKINAGFLGEVANVVFALVGQLDTMPPRR
jgi:hypothetical protein